MPSSLSPRSAAAGLLRRRGSRSTNILLSKWSLRMASTTDNKSSLRSGPRKVGWMIGGLFDHDHSYSDQEALEARNVLRLWVDRHPDS